ncbi:MAG: hypothetical protein ACOC1P_04265 [Minisyncoccales bacterium]
MNRFLVTMFVLIISLSLVSPLYLDSDSKTGIERDSNADVSITSSSETETSDSNDSDKSKQVIVNIDGTNVKTYAEVRGNSQANSTLRLSNGNEVIINVNPSAAVNIAINNTNAERCSDNCSIEMKEISSNGETRATYEIEVEKPYRFLGIIKSNADVKVNVDTETGAIVDVNRPWWTSISTSAEAEANANANSRVGVN